MANAGIYKIKNGEMVKKMACIFREAPVTLFFLLLPLIVVLDLDSDDFIDNDGETKTSVLLLPRDNAGKEDE